MKQQPKNLNCRLNKKNKYKRSRRYVWCLQFLSQTVTHASNRRSIEDSTSNRSSRSIVHLWMTAAQFTMWACVLSPSLFIFSFFVFIFMLCYPNEIMYKLNPWHHYSHLFFFFSLVWTGWTHSIVYNIVARCKSPWSHTRATPSSNHTRIKLYCLVPIPLDNLKLSDITHCAIKCAQCSLAISLSLSLARIDSLYILQQHHPNEKGFLSIHPMCSLCVA